MKNKKGKVYPNPHLPVGSIYMSVNNTNPSIWFGGKWEQISQGRTLVGVDASQTEFNTVKKTGGSKFLQRHNHQFGGQNGIDDTSSLYSPGTAYPNFPSINKGGNWYGNGVTYIKETGEGDSGNLQPYFTCYIWCRIA